MCRDATRRSNSNGMRASREHLIRAAADQLFDVGLSLSWRRFCAAWPRGPGWAVKSPAEAGLGQRSKPLGGGIGTLPALAGLEKRPPGYWHTKSPAEAGLRLTTPQQPRPQASHRLQTAPRASTACPISTSPWPPKPSGDITKPTNAFALRSKPWKPKPSKPRSVNL